MLLFSKFFGMKFWCLLLNSNLCKKNESFMLLISKLSGMKFRSLLLNNSCKRNVLSFPWIIFSMFHSLLLVKNNMTSCWSTNYILMCQLEVFKIYLGFFPIRAAFCSDWSEQICFFYITQYVKLFMWLKFLYYIN